MNEYKVWIIEILESWAETFTNNYPDHMEEVIGDEDKTYNFIHLLIGKFRKDTCSNEDYENILFHLWQSKCE